MLSSEGRGGANPHLAGEEELWREEEETVPVPFTRVFIQPSSVGPTAQKVAHNTSLLGHSEIYNVMKASVRPSPRPPHIALSQELS